MSDTDSENKQQPSSEKWVWRIGLFVPFVFLLIVVILSRTNQPQSITQEDAIIEPEQEPITMDPSTMKTITIESNTGNEYAITHLDLSKYDDLEVLRIGNGCFKNVKEVRIVGLQQLVRVSIGRNSFTRERENGRRSNYRFILRDCESLKELQIGRGSFSSYSAIELENLPALTELTIGDVKAKSNNFFDSSLELKDLPQLSHVFFGESSFYACNSVVFENLPQLSSIVLGPDAFRFYESEASSFLTLKNLSKLATIQSPATKHKSFRDVHHLHFETLPSLSIVTLPPMAFSNRESITMTNVGGLQSNPLIPCLLKEAELCSCADLRSIDAYITRLSVGNNCCNDRSLTVIDLTGNSFLQELSIGNNSLNGVRRVTIAGQKKLTSISIGNNCSRTEHTDDKAFIFSVSECPVLKEISIGSYSFSTFDQFKAANLPSLETVSIGMAEEDAQEYSVSFHLPSSAAEMGRGLWERAKKGVEWVKSGAESAGTSGVAQTLWEKAKEGAQWVRARAESVATTLPQSKDIITGTGSFQQCESVVFENLPKLTSIRLGYNVFSFDSVKEPTSLVLQDLPRLHQFITSRRVVLGNTFRYPRRITLENMPRLTNLMLSSYAFENKKRVTVDK
ncbi:hypothetical protein WA556_005923, partial [Blastocystis sp. ATCC 50177/Nand II]